MLGNSVPEWLVVTSNNVEVIFCLLMQIQFLEDWDIKPSRSYFLSLLVKEMKIKLACQRISKISRKFLLCARQPGKQETFAEISEKKRETQSASSPTGDSRYMKHIYWYHIQFISNLSNLLLSFPINVTVTIWLWNLFLLSTTITKIRFFPSHFYFYIQISYCWVVYFFQSSSGY